MPASSNFNKAIREAHNSPIVGSNVLQKALPYVGGAMILTSLGILFGITLIYTNPSLFKPIYFDNLIVEISLFFVAKRASNNSNNSRSLILLILFSLLTGFALSGIVGLVIGTNGMGSVGTAALATGIIFLIASYTVHTISNSVRQALSRVVSLGLIGLLIAFFIQFIGGFFAPGVFGRSVFDFINAGFGTALFVIISFLDFYTMPRKYSDKNYLVGALSMYLTYTNLILYTLRFMVPLQGVKRKV